jgi:hypothetical protein
MARDPETLAHQQWLGYLQPVGLVVSPPALVQAQAHVNTNVAVEHQRFREHVVPGPVFGNKEPLVVVKDLPAMLLDILGWQRADLAEASDPRAASLEFPLPDYHETLRPTFAVPDDVRTKRGAWLLLLQEIPVGTPFDEIMRNDERRWQATPHARFERLLRETQVPIGLLSNGSHLRLVYAPRGETTGHLTFPVQAMTEVAGRPIFAALLMLLGADRLFTLPDKQRLPAILADSRKYQNTVSTELARQVLAALYELLRGFQAANDLSKGDLLREVLERNPGEVYSSLLTVLLRLVFLLYAEDRGLMSDDEVFVRNYSVTGLFERLREDAGRYPDTMDLRYGAWAQLLVLFRLVYQGARHGRLRLPARQGFLFNPDRYPFLEGRVPESSRGLGQKGVVPRVGDGVVYRVLRNLLLIDGERISYRSLDVEQIGSVYETMMGFRLEQCGGRSIAIKPAKAHGAPVTINLEELLRVSGKDRGKWLKEATDQSVSGAALNALKAADTSEALVAALERKVARDLTPDIVPPGGMVLQPSEERRRSGLHYTPRSLTEPIVRKALEPVLERLGPHSTPEQILDLKTCDFAMGSGAFLVEVCRQLSEALVEAWSYHRQTPTIPPDEDELLHARRLVAQRCLYGVDKNPVAVELATLSLWLATLAKDHDFTFLEHALREGDSLVGLSREQMAGLHWKPRTPLDLFRHHLQPRMEQVLSCRADLLALDDETPLLLKRQKLKLADDALNTLRRDGSMVIAAYFSADKDKQREARLLELTGNLVSFHQKRDFEHLRPVMRAVTDLGFGSRKVVPFHWEIEFPEVFRRDNPGFDCIVGNPPFAGKNTIIDGNRPGYLGWLKVIHEGAHGNADLVAHFYRRAFNVLREGGTFGLIATNTIAQGDTRTTGLRWICTHGGTIYSARRRYKWPGQAAVVVSVVHVIRGGSVGERTLDGRPVPLITAYLFHAGGHENPATLKANEDKSFQGSNVLGMGFTFDDTDKDGVASPLSAMHELLARNPRNQERIFPYIGGEEVNDSPTHAFHRFVINFGEMDEENARQWPDLMLWLEEKVKGKRKDYSQAPWWQLERPRTELYEAIKPLSRVIANPQVSAHFAFAFLPVGWVYGHTVNVFAFQSYCSFAVLQARVHEVWARFFASSLEERLRYTPSDCFETFPFPEDYAADTDLEADGQAYYDFRAALMVRNNEGLTKTYNRFHDPNERSPDILRLRELHAAMDRAVLDAYGWTDLERSCEFLLDYEEDEEEATGRQRKKPWRYRWPDDFRDEVLARLLELNKRRADQEQLEGDTGPKRKRR